MSWSKNDEWSSKNISNLCIQMAPSEPHARQERALEELPPLGSFIFVNIVNDFPCHYWLHQSLLTSWGLGWLPIHSSPGRCCRVRRVGDQENSVDSVAVWFLCRLITWNYYIFLDLAIPYDIGTSSRRAVGGNIVCIFLYTFFFGHMYASLA